MPDRHSRPPSPASTVPATTVSQSSPASTVSWTLPAAPQSILPPPLASRTTVPGKPASATTRLEPPPRTSSGSPERSAARIASATSSARAGSRNRAAGPPRRSVVYPDRGTAVRASVPMGTLVMGYNGNLRRMPTRFEHRATFTSPAATVYATLVDRAFLEARLAALGGKGAAIIDYSGSGDEVSFRLRQGLDAEK